MIKEIRKAYNANFSEERYEAMKKDMNDKYHYEIMFRLAETPIFVDNDFRDRLIAAGNEIADFVQNPAFLQMSESAIPEGLCVPNDPNYPGMLAIDFAICQDENGDWLPQLIEAQGFPSLYAHQVFCSEMYQKHFIMPEDFTFYLNGYDREKYMAHFRELILNGHNPENVVLMEIEPYLQKTAIDFYVTEDYLGIKSICISEVILEGKKLFYMLNGVKTPIHRLYNRVIFDELTPRTDLKRQFNLIEEVDVEWVSHPNWFFRVSKYTLPFLKSKYVPDTHFLSEITEYPSDLENYVLKPLFSFAGQGVILNVTPADIEKVEDKANWILQKKVKYIPIFEDPEGNGVKGEIRLLYMYDKTLNKCVLTTNLGRLSKGAMIGVRYNKDFTWVGGSTYFFRK